MCRTSDEDERREGRRKGRRVEGWASGRASVKQVMVGGERQAASNDFKYLSRRLDTDSFRAIAC